jgi:hypothetical protein
MLRSFLTYLCLFVSLCAIAQKNVPALEREVTLKVSDEPISSVLNKISAQTGVTFSYSPSLVPVTKKVSFVLKNKPTRTVLRIMFGEEVQYKQRGDFIILIAKTPPPVQEVKEITISGYVYDANGDKLTSASILSKSEHLSAVTNQYGYYKMSVPANRFPVKIKVEKENYVDTTLTVNANQRDVDVVLTTPEKEKQAQALPVETQPAQQAPPDTTLSKKSTPAVDTTEQQPATTGLTPPPPLPLPKQKWSKHFFDSLFLSPETKANMRNIKDTLFTKVQFSLIPYVSTNKLLAGNTVNELSINMLVGYSQGVNAAEVAGLINIDRGDVKYFQAAGLINAVGGNVKGAQLAGWANLNSGSGEGFRAAGLFNVGNNMDGVQLAGIFNINADYKSGLANKSLKGLTESKVKGFEAAGVLNVNAGYSEGVMLAGLYNAANKTKGVQIAGLANGNIGSMHGVQIAGLLNTTVDTSSGLHLAGLMNINGRRSEGVHIAGLVNIALGDVEGLQLAPILNVARNIKGAQIGLLNFSDSCEGVAFGLLTISAKGYHKIEVYGDEVIYTQLAFRTGVPYFHNIFTAGIDMTNRFNGLWTFGYGLGTNIRTSEKWSFTADAISQVILIRGDIEDAPEMITLYTGMERSFGKKFAIGLGPTCRIMINDSPANAEYTGIANKLIPYSFYNHTFNNGNKLDMWVGAKLSINFL